MRGTLRTRAIERRAPDYPIAGLQTDLEIGNKYKAILTRDRFGPRLPDSLCVTRIAPRVDKGSPGVLTADLLYASQLGLG